MQTYQPYAGVSDAPTCGNLVATCENALATYGADAEACRNDVNSIFLPWVCLVDGMVTTMKIKLASSIPGNVPTIREFVCNCLTHYMHGSFPDHQLLNFVMSGMALMVYERVTDRADIELDVPGMFSKIQLGPNADRDMPPILEVDYERFTALKHMDRFLVLKDQVTANGTTFAKLAKFIGDRAYTVTVLTNDMEYLERKAQGGTAVTDEEINKYNNQKAYLNSIQSVDASQTNSGVPTQDIHQPRVVVRHNGVPYIISCSSPEYTNFSPMNADPSVPEVNTLRSYLFR